MSTSNTDAKEWFLDGQSGFGLIFLTLAFFQSSNFFLSFLPLPRSVAKSANDFRIFRWRNLIVSWLHACITGFGSAICLFLYRDEIYNDAIEFANWPCYFVACFSTGYFFYDSLDIILARRIREKWEILIHHTAIVVAALYCISSVHCIGYHVLSMAIEFNTAFLHTRKIMLMGGIRKNHPLVTLTTYLNLITFILFRFLPILTILYAIPRYYDRVPLWFAIQLTTSMIVLTIINFILFYRLLQTDFLAPNRHPRRKEAELCDSMDVDLPSATGLASLSSSPNISQHASFAHLPNGVAKDGNFKNR